MNNSEIKEIINLIINNSEFTSLSIAKLDEDEISMSIMVKSLPKAKPEQEDEFETL